MPDMPEEGEERERPTPPPIMQPGRQANTGEGELAEFASIPAAEVPPTDLGPMLGATGRVLNERQAALIEQIMAGVRLPPDSYWDEEEVILRAALLPEIEAQVIAGAEAAATGLEMFPSRSQSMSAPPCPKSRADPAARSRSPMRAQPPQEHWHTTPGRSEHARQSTAPGPDSARRTAWFHRRSPGGG